LFRARKILSGLILLVLLAALAGCSNLTVNYDYDQNTDWAKYKTYSWMPLTPPKTDPTATVANTPLLQQRIMSSVDLVMKDRGIAEKDSSDLLVIFHVGAQDKLQVTDWGYRYSDYYWGYGGRQIDVYEFTEGSLVIDLIDADSKNLVWRGTGSGVVDQTQRTPEQMQERMNGIVATIMKSFPPK